MRVPELCGRDNSAENPVRKGAVDTARNELHHGSSAIGVLTSIDCPFQGPLPPNNRSKRTLGSRRTTRMIVANCQGKLISRAPHFSLRTMIRAA